LLKLIVKTTEIYQLLFSSFAGAGSWQLAMIQPYLFFVDVQLLLHITLLGFALVPDSVGTGIKLAVIFLVA
jgi:hypothetical protein